MLAQVETYASLLINIFASIVISKDMEEVFQIRLMMYKNLDP